MSCECVPVEIFVDKVLCRLLPDGPEPLRAERSHPDEIAGLRGVPLVPEPVNTTSLEHQETMLRLAHGGSGLVGHRVASKVEGGA